MLVCLFVAFDVFLGSLDASVRRVLLDPDKAAIPKLLLGVGWDGDTERFKMDRRLLAVPEIGERNGMSRSVAPLVYRDEDPDVCGG